jgi:hypothetical protein
MTGGFGPVDVKVGPDGAVWMADWYDSRLSHVRPVDDWSKGDGRIYRVRPTAATMRREKAFDLHTAPAAELLAGLGTRTSGFGGRRCWNWLGAVKKASCRNWCSVCKRARAAAAGAYAFDALCALHLLGGLTDEVAIALLKHDDPYVRRWVVRCAGDAGKVSAALAAAIGELATREAHPEVRTQLACSVRRWPAAVALPIVRTMLTRDADARDKRMPLLLWWAIEDRAETERAALLAWFADRALWEAPLARTQGARLLARRWAQAGGAENYDACARLLGSAPRETDRAVVVEGMAAAFEGGGIPKLPAALAGALDAYLQEQARHGSRARGEDRQRRGGRAGVEGGGRRQGGAGVARVARAGARGSGQRAGGACNGENSRARGPNGTAESGAGRGGEVCRRANRDDGDFRIRGAVCG